MATAACCLSCELRCAWHCPRRRRPRPPLVSSRRYCRPARHRPGRRRRRTASCRSALTSDGELMSWSPCLKTLAWSLNVSWLAPAAVCLPSCGSIHSALPLRTSWAAAELLRCVGQLTWRFLSCCVCRQLCSGPGRWARHHLWKVLPCSHHHCIMPLRSSHTSRTALTVRFASQRFLPPAQRPLRCPAPQGWVHHGHRGRPVGGQPLRASQACEQHAGPLCASTSAHTGGAHGQCQRVD